MAISELSDSDLLKYNDQGLIPGPNESLSAYNERIQACLGLKELIAKSPSQTFPFQPDELSSPSILENATSKILALYAIDPKWLPIFFSNYRLAPWHGGCAWIFQLEDEGPRMAFLQLRKSFAIKKNYLSLYNRDELVAHESAHVGRMLFDEPRFEEILAYRSSQSTWRAWLAPIVQSSTESLVFIGTLFSILLLDFYYLITGNEETYLTMSWMKAIPLGLFFLALIRLGRRQRTFKKCLKTLQILFQDVDQIKTSERKENSPGINEALANHVIFRLTDDEITHFASLDASSIWEYAQTERTKTLRWRLLWLAYFSKITR